MNWQPVQATETWFLRTMMGISWMEHVSKEEELIMIINNNNDTTTGIDTSTSNAVINVCPA